MSICISRCSLKQSLSNSLPQRPSRVSPTPSITRLVRCEATDDNNKLDRRQATIASVSLAASLLASGSTSTTSLFSAAQAAEQDTTSTPEITDKVYFDISVGGEPQGRITFGLYGNVVPKTVANFVSFTVNNQEPKSGYKGCTFHRVVKGFVLQGGDFERGNGTGGKSIYGRKFPDENFEIPHAPFSLSMANAGPNTNGSQFFITLGETPWLNGKHVVFGKVIEGQELADKLQYAAVDRGNKPVKPMVISDCGRL